MVYQMPFKKTTLALFKLNKIFYKLIFNTSKKSMRLILTMIMVLGVTINGYTQKMTFVMDSIMKTYMKTGFATKNFRPEGKVDKDKSRQGFWKDYEVMNDFEYIAIDGKPTQIFGHFLIYGEGEFVDGNRNGNWQFYVLEDKTFKKILQQQVSFVKGKKVGSFKYFYPNGNTGIEGKYVDNEMEGEIKSYYEDGKLYGLRLYTNGLRTGKHTYIYPNGKLKLVHNFTNDTLNGLYQTFYSNGNKQEVFTYKMGIEDGIYQYYYENGQLWTEQDYNTGLLINVNSSFDPQGKPRNKGTIKDGNGTLNYYSEDGKIYLIRTFKDGKKIKEDYKNK
jgi:antitoxin component YwqK of YwqJK toxin-antitoxin module